MHPYAIEAQTMQPHRVSGVLEQGGERELSARGVLEQCGRKYCRPGVDEGRDLLFGAFKQTTIRCHGKIATSGIADAAGRGCKQQKRIRCSRVEKIGEFPPAISITAIVIICSYVVAANRNNLGQATLIILSAVIFHNIVGMLLGFLAGSAAKYDFRRKKTLSIEIGMQNAGLGVILSLQHFSQKVAIPSAIFTIWCIVSASVLVNFWKYIERERKPNDE